LPAVANGSTLSRANEAIFSRRTFEARESRLRKAFAMLGAEPARGRLLDVAAGSGIAAEALREQGWTISALELSPALAEQLRDRGIDDVREHDLASGPLPFEDGTFAAVFAGEIIEHLVDTGAFVAELQRVLAPGGVAVITTPNLASLENRVRLLFGRYPRWSEWELPVDGAAAPFHDQGHVRSYTARTLRGQLAVHGFVTEELRGNWVPIVPQRFLNDLLLPPIARTGDWLPALSQGLIVKARRAPARATP
jgi:SAM-dependent methyltransferase